MKTQQEIVKVIKFLMTESTTAMANLKVAQGSFKAATQYTMLPMFLIGAFAIIWKMVDINQILYIMIFIISICLPIF